MGQDNVRNGMCTRLCDWVPLLCGGTLTALSTSGNGGIVKTIKFKKKKECYFVFCLHLCTPNSPSPNKCLASKLDSCGLFVSVLGCHLLPESRPLFIQGILYVQFIRFGFQIEAVIEAWRMTALSFLIAVTGSEAGR